ncbi:hypothetical protein DV495_000230 [Geotrichum candidum]|uniref:Uncharacterized protein n=1 Tax=Geotrichum candidum TaxID=1173061 RepID=A0A0J9X7M0_GEOCN|nr:hypothetical protein DV453_000193 [Geotrichum candidum]KAI9214019.1 hypothetical protein DS838_001057 [Geotrichum bryndzae]KAF5115928.1 hypothetical protein DV454_001996 [Geotrichum candidum]KAF5120079.1 hypothetical protein DV452_001269 [Geotrichum candidum]KAF5135974.1 hypothetical protein DV495_000230 [Geotrichum candidum]
MANASAKKQAAANTKKLQELHTIAAIINGLYLLAHFVLGRPRGGSIKPYLFCSLPAFLLQYQLERMGRPKYSPLQPGSSQQTLVSPGDDLAQAGLTEWFHDVIYVTWGCDILAPIFNTNKVWYLYLLIPLYASYKIYTLIFSGKGGGLLGGLLGNAGRGDAAADMNAAPAQSKRQEKLEKRANKVKYKY